MIEQTRPESVQQAAEKSNGLNALGGSAPNQDPLPPPFLRLEGLSKSYQEGKSRRLVLDNVTASMQPGEITAILGRSGSGKSTLLNLISGIDKADSGTIWLSGENLTAMDERSRTLFRREHIGFVFQFFNLIPTLTVWENVTLPLELGGRLNSGRAERARELLDSVGLLDRGSSFPDRLSGGEQQRVAIARALVHDPLLVLADEPTGNLDEATGRRVIKLLDLLTRKAGKNLVIVTHSLEAASVADRTLRLQGGVLIEVEPGSHSSAGG